MTLYRPPSSFESALHRIADHLGGMEEVARVAERTASTVYAWASPNEPDSVPAALMLRLDVAYRRAGGIGAPLRDAYELQLDAAMAEEFGDSIELMHATARTVREVGQAQAALINAALPGADDAAFAEVEREGEEGLAALTASIAIAKRVRRRRRSTAPPAQPP